jgi:hypothetical protein
MSERGIVVKHCFLPFASLLNTLCALERDLYYCRTKRTPHKLPPLAVRRYTLASYWPRGPGRLCRAALVLLTLVPLCAHDYTHFRRSLRVAVPLCRRGLYSASLRASTVGILLYHRFSSHPRDIGIQRRPRPTGCTWRD